jgi:integrase
LPGRERDLDDGDHDHGQQHQRPCQPDQSARALVILGPARHNRIGKLVTDALSTWPTPDNTVFVFNGGAAAATVAVPGRRCDRAVAQRATVASVRERAERTPSGRRHVSSTDRTQDRRRPGRPSELTVELADRIHRAKRANGSPAYVVRWREASHNRRRTFDRRADASLWDAEVRRRRQLGVLHTLDAGSESLDRYVAETFTPAHAATLARATRDCYAATYDRHISPVLGDLSLRDLRPDVIARWQSDRLAAGCGPVAIHQAVRLLGTIMQRATEDQRIQANPVRLIRKARPPKSAEVVPLAPAAIEAMRTYLLAGGSEQPLRDATLVSVLAYSGLRPGEALGLTWGDVRERTILVQRTASYGEAKDTKTNANRTVRLLDPLRRDLAEWRLAAGRPHDATLVFPGHDGRMWSKAAYQSWRRRAFLRALRGAGIDRARPYDLRHSFASLLLHEGRSVIYVARQLGHDARLTLTRYGHVIDELDGTPQISAEDAIRAARAADVPLSFLAHGDV